MINRSNIKKKILHKLLNEKFEKEKIRKNFLNNEKPENNLIKSKSFSGKISMIKIKKLEFKLNKDKDDLILNQIDFIDLKKKIKEFIDYFKNLYLYKFDSYLEKINKLKEKQYITLENIISLNNKYFNTFLKDQNKYSQIQLRYYLNTISYEIFYDKLINYDENNKSEDFKLSQKVVIFQNIVNKKSLNLNINKNNNLYQLAIMEILKINNYKNPDDKFNILYNLIEIIKSISKVEFINNDELFKYLIYIIIMSNCKLLFTNIQFLFNFTDKDELIGKKGFILTIFLTTIKYLNEINGKDLINGKLTIQNDI